MGLSREGRIGIAIGAIVAIMLVLIQPERAAWRLSLLLTLAGITLYAARELNWVNQVVEDLSIFHPGIFRSFTIVRFSFAASAAILLTVLFGIITWPPQFQNPIEAVQPSQPPASGTPVNIVVPAPDAIIKNKPKPKLPLPHVKKP